MMLLEGSTSKARELLIGERQPRKKGVLPTAVSGVGTDVTLRFLDGLIGSPMQRFITFPLPIIGGVGVIDVINFLVNGGPRNFRGGLTAVIGAKVMTAGLTSLGPIRLPTGASPTGAPTAQAPGGASF
jgi:hypothetical protein